jgi:hypothetical protein
MKKVSRRSFVTHTFGAAAALSFSTRTSYGGATAGSDAPQDAPEIIDTNIHLFQWPFRHLKYGNTKALVEKLRKHRITQAWAGSYEALFYKDINGVNARLAQECRSNGDGMLLPFGTVNLAWPDWEEDLRRCHEVHKMRGIRICPIYQTFNLDHPDFPKLVKLVSEKKMLLQIVGDMEDSRHHHPTLEVRDMTMAPVVDVMKQIPDAKIQLLYWNHRVPRNLLASLVQETNVAFDTSRVEGAGEVGRLIEGRSWTGSPTAIPSERFLFGSHAPYFPVETNIIKLFESPLTEQQTSAIMNGNARQLLKVV